MRFGPSARGRADLPEIDIGQGGAEAQAQLGGDPGPSGGGSSPPTRWIVGAVVVGMVGLWVLSGLASDSAEGPPEEVAANEPEPQLVEPTPVPTPTPTPVPSPTPDVFLDTRAANVARAQLAIAGPSHTIAYTAEGGLGVLDMSSGRVALLDPGVEDPSSNVAVGMLAAEYGFGREDLGLLSRMLTGDLVATTGEDGILARVAGMRSVVFVFDVDGGGEFLGRHDLPAAASVAALDGYGITAFVEGTGTYVVDAAGLTLLTDAELLAANEHAWLERRCAPDCEVTLVDKDTGDAWVLPPSFSLEGSRYSLSPDGRFVLHINAGGGGEIFLPETNGVRYVNHSGIVHAAWSPDSSFVAWIDMTEEPVLKMMLPDRADWIVVKLGVLEAPVPAPGELHVLAQID